MTVYREQEKAGGRIIDRQNKIKKNYRCLEWGYKVREGIQLFNTQR